MATKAKKTPLSKDEEIEALKVRLAELESSEEEVKPIRQDEYIPVMSLIPFNLNLSTKEAGQGNVKKFTHFGEVKRILYKDLIDIMEVHPNFLEAGYFYILHPAFIRQNGLDDAYSKILTKEKIEEILSTNSENCVDLYNSANPSQQEIIIQLLVDKVINNYESVNLNVIDRISRASKVDILRIAEDQKAARAEKVEE